MRLFLSYRRDDSEGHVGWLADNLPQISDPDDPIERFIDVYDIPAGRDFVREILLRIKECDAVLAIIGSQWLTITGDGGKRRLDEPDDPVRLELSAAIENSIPLVVALVGGASQPTGADLPRSIAGLGRAKAFILRDEEFLSDARRLIAYLKSEGVTRRRPGEKPPTAKVQIVNAEPGWFQNTSELKVYLDGKQFAKIVADDGVYTFQIPSGRHQLHLRRGLIYATPKMEVTLKPGQVVRLGYIWKDLGGMTWKFQEDQDAV